MSKEIMTIKEVSEYLKMNYRTVYRLAERGEIPAFKLGKNWRVKKDLLDKWIEEQIKRNNLSESNQKKKKRSDFK